MRALDDLVTGRQGSLYRFFGHPGVESRAGADHRAVLKGWTPLIALQLEYSLLERTIEGELIPAALEFGHGRDAVVVR